MALVRPSRLGAMGYQRPRQWPLGRAVVMVHVPSQVLPRLALVMPRPAEAVRTVRVDPSRYLPQRRPSIHLLSDSAILPLPLRNLLQRLSAPPLTRRHPTSPLRTVKLPRSLLILLRSHHHPMHRTMTRARSTRPTSTSNRKRTTRTRPPPRSPRRAPFRTTHRHRVTLISRYNDSTAMAASSALKRASRREEGACLPPTARLALPARPQPPPVSQRMPAPRAQQPSALRQPLARQVMSLLRLTRTSTQSSTLRVCRRTSLRR